MATDLKRTDMGKLRWLHEAKRGTVQYAELRHMTRERLLSNGLIRIKAPWQLTITPAGREALRAATNPETKPS